MSFDWQTDETFDWSEKPAQISVPEKEPTPRRRWPWIMVVVMLLFVGTTIVAFRLLTNRVDEATEDVTSEVIASYAVVEGAAVEADPELFATFLSGKDKDWSDMMEQLVSEGRYQNRESFGLTWLHADPTTAVISTTMSPDLTAAEVLSEHDYAYDIGNGLTKTVRLQQTAVYRVGADRWLFAPPDGDFWGETRTKEGYYLSLTYPERDAAIAKRLALDLDTKLAELCTEQNFSCENGFHVAVVLSTAPVSLSAEFAASAFDSEEWQIALPTPTLVGLPQSEAAYRVLSRGYLTQAMIPIIDELSGWSCCAHAPFYEAWAAGQLQRLGLRPSLVTPSDWQVLAEQEVSLVDGQASWAAGNADEASLRLVYGVMSFLLNDLQISSKTLLESLTDDSLTSYNEWLQTITRHRYRSDELEERWQQYLLRKQPA